MPDSLLRRGIRRAMRSVNRFAFGEDQEGVPGPRFAYRELNALLMRLLREGGPQRTSYAWGTLHAAHLAKVLGIGRISAIEFGVAEGGGLLSLERTARAVGRMCAVSVDVYGFDTGSGLPPPTDYRDSPNLYVEHAFSMPIDRFRASLQEATLLLGLVEETVPRFLQSRPAPIGFVSFDLDYYSSTRHAFAVLEADPDRLLPRIHCYFDDIVGFTHGDYTGERLAISEFNASHPSRKLSPIYGLRYFLPTAYRSSSWPECMYLAHIFDHPLYAVPDGLTYQPRRSSA
jgi:hypothetical protein